MLHFYQEEIFIASAVLVLSALLTGIYRRWALKKSVMDIPNHRSSHDVPTPRGGGMVFVLLWYIGLSLLYFFDLADEKLFWAFMPGLLLVLVGFLDDVMTLSPKWRIIAQTLAAAGSLFFTGGMGAVDTGLFVIDSPIILSLFAFVFILWMINLFNFLDGIDGYVATESILLLGLFVLISGFALPLILAAGVFGFLLWNWQKAKIFMGDTGSTFLGYAVAVFMIHFNNSGDMNFIVGLIATSLFWFDATYTVIRRLLNGETFYKAHRKHLYQRLVRSGFSHQKTVLVLLVAFNTALFGIAYTTVFFPKLQLPGLALSIILSILLTVFVNRRFPFESRQNHSPNSPK